MELRRPPTVFPALLLLAACSSAQGNADDLGDHGTGRAEGGGTDGGADDEIPDTTPVVRAAQPPLPIYGGTLEVLPDGRHAVAADPDRDLIWIVDALELEEVGAVELEPGAQPWRMTGDGAGRVHVSLRGAGELLTFDSTTGDVLARRAVCDSPRGVAQAGGTVWVTCLSGSVLQLPADPEAPGEVTQFADLEPDLRDVVVTQGNVVASYFGSTLVDVVPRLEDAQYLAPGSPVAIDRGLDQNVPSAAWRMRKTPDGGWLVAHQYGTDEAIELPPPPGEPQDDDGGGDGDGGYGGDTHVDKCQPVSTAAITLVRTNGRVRTTGPIGKAGYIVDAALSPDGKSIALAMPGRGIDPETGPLPSVGIIETDKTRFVTNFGHPPCRKPAFLQDLPDSEIVAVAFLEDGRLLAQSREPAMVVRIDLQGDATTSWLRFDTASIEDTGHQLFHHDAGEGVSCASCHPEGGSDGRVWRFEDIGLRRTQPLDAGIADSEPLHWDGEFVDLADLIDNVHRRRMGGQRQSAERTDAFAEWVESIPIRPPIRPSDDAAALRGAKAYVQYGCGHCHRGESTTQTESVELAGEMLQVPSLLGIGSRYPLMHDGRAETLHEAVADMFARTLPDDETHTVTTVAEIAAYLETL